MQTTNLSSSTSFNANLEALRGTAALVVVWHHLTYFYALLDPHYWLKGVSAFSPPGHAAVLVFFYAFGLCHRRINESAIVA